MLFSALFLVVEFVQFGVPHPRLEGLKDFKLNHNEGQKNNKYWTYICWKEEILMDVKVWNSIWEEQI